MSKRIPQELKRPFKLGESELIYPLTKYKVPSRINRGDLIMIILIRTITFAILMFPQLSFASHPFDLIIETGGVWQNRNDTQIPPNTGTRLEIDNFDEGPFFHHRLEAYYRIAKNHALRLVYAPSQINVTGRTNNPVLFNGQTFSNTEDLNIKYRFNSYRLSYLYGFTGFGKDQINVGFTAKIRDAETTFSQGSINSSYDNIGFVPLIYFEYQKALGKKWGLNFTMDAAAASQGRAIDAALKIRRLIGESSSLGLGFRSLEGGADNEKVFTFSWFNYALIEIKLGF